MPYQVIQNLIANDGYHVERLLRRYRVNEHVAMDSNEVL
jgi:hypothetical protein